MKKSLDAKPLNGATARNCFLLNQLATPGLGSLMGKRIVAGVGQLVLALIGFALIIVWFVLTLKDYYGLMTRDIQPKSYGSIGLAGAAVFAVAWVWALFTSTSLMNEAKN